jgi:protein-arginine kinase activator protein McsA
MIYKMNEVFVFSCMYCNAHWNSNNVIYFLVDPGSWDSRQIWTQGEVYSEDKVVSSRVHQLLTSRRSRNTSWNSFICPECGKTYRYKKNLSRHRRLECGKEPQFHCLYCPHKTTQKGNLLLHIKKIHPYSN